VCVNPGVGPRQKHVRQQPIIVITKRGFRANPCAPQKTTRRAGWKGTYSSPKQSTSLPWASTQCVDRSYTRMLFFKNAARGDANKKYEKGCTCRHVHWNTALSAMQAARQRSPATECGQRPGKCDSEREHHPPLPTPRARAEAFRQKLRLK
jgi:hypothetical protein